MMKHGELLQRIRKGQYDPIYLFVGEEEFLKEESIRLLSDTLVDPQTKEFNFDLLYGGETEGSAIVDIATAYPMMTDRRVVILRDIHKCSVKDRKALLAYAANPAPSTCLICAGPKVDLRKSFYKELSKAALTVVFWPLFENQIPAWIRKHTQNKGKDISTDAMITLQNLVGSSLQELANEIDKLVTYCGDQARIEKTDVIKVVGGTKVNSVFDLVDVVAGKKTDLSLQILHSLFESGESEVGMVWMLTRHFVILAKVHQLQTDGYRGDKIAGRMKLRPKMMTQYLQQARQLSQRQLKTAFQLLLEADANLKSSYQAPRLIMELLVMKLCQLRDDASGTKGIDFFG